MDFDGKPIISSTWMADSLCVPGLSLPCLDCLDVIGLTGNRGRDINAPGF